MARTSKKEQKLKKYGDVQQTIPVLIPNTRYHALKILAYQKGSTINKIVRDAIEETFGEELDKIENEFSADNDQLESSEVSFNANERMQMIG
jgi:hypothetical protein